MALPGCVVDPEGKLPTRYYGIRAISERLGICHESVRNWFKYRGLPVIRKSCNRKFSAVGWTYYIDEIAIQRFLDIESGNMRLAQRVAGRTLQPTEQAKRLRETQAELTFKGAAIVWDGATDSEIKAYNSTICTGKV